MHCALVKKDDAHPRHPVDPEACAQVASMRVITRTLWELLPDGFIEHALPRLLRNSGFEGLQGLRTVLLHWPFIEWRVKAGDVFCDSYLRDIRNGYRNQAEGADVPFRVESAVESTWSSHDASFPGLRQPAWDVAELFESHSRDNDGEAQAFQLVTLCQTARCTQWGVHEAAEGPLEVGHILGCSEWSWERRRCAHRV